MTEIKLVTIEDMEQFKTELFEQLQELRSSKPKLKWLRSKDVRVMLNISDSTLQTLRINGTIPSYKLGTSWFYKHDEIVAILEAGKIGRNDSHD